METKKLQELFEENDFIVRLEKFGKTQSAEIEKWTDFHNELKELVLKLNK